MSEAPDPIVQEFLLESREHLDQLDRDLVTLESEPGSSATLARAFRALHTLKGTCGFLGFTRLGAIGHAGEGLLARLRDGDVTFSLDVASALLTLVDRVRRLLDQIERTGSEGTGDDSVLLSALQRLQGAPATGSAPSMRPVEPEEEPADEPSGSTPGDARIKVDVQRLDRLMDLVGELVLARNQLVTRAGSADPRTVQEATQRMSALTSQIQSEVMETRLQPIATAWDRLPRLVRDTAVACGKEVRLELEGGATEIDRSVLDAIRDPLVHLVRNAIDHGIESPTVREACGKARAGVLRLSASHAGGRVRLEVSDDGAGIPVDRVRARALERGLVADARAQHMSDREWLDLVFRAGFTTTDKVTSVSGRGVGLDVVREHLAAIGGSVEVRTQPLAGTTFELRLPLTLAIVPALVVACGDERYALPQSAVLEVVRTGPGRNGAGIVTVAGGRVLRLRDALIPLVSLREQFEVPGKAPEHGFAVVLQSGASCFALQVDETGETQEVVVRPIGAAHRGLAVFAGVTLLGDGRVALILDPAGTARRAGLGLDLPVAVPVPPTQPVAPEHEWLVCELREGWFGALPLGEVLRIEEFGRDQIERLGGQLVARWRGQMLPLVELAGAIDPDRATSRLSRRRLTAVVHESAGVPVGWLVDQVLDAVVTIEIPAPVVPRTGVRGTAELVGHPVDLLDPSALLAPGGSCERLARRAAA